VRRSGVAIGGYRNSRGRSLARTRRAPRSRRALIVTMAVVAVSLALLIWGGWWLLTSPEFAIARVESGAYRFSSREEIDSVMRGALGRNIWTLDTGDLGQAFEDLPWVRSVHLRRRVPDTVALELEEWRPLLTVARSGDEVPLILVADGRVLRLPAHLPPPGLPVLVGAAVAPDTTAVLRLAGSAAEQTMLLLSALSATGFESAFPVDFVRVEPEGMVLELAQRAGRLRLGREDFDPRLRRYLLARDRIPHGATVDLRFADRITFEPPAAQQP